MNHNIAGKVIVILDNMKYLILILLILANFSCSPVRNRGYQPGSGSGDKDFEYKYSDADSTSEDDFFGEDAKDGKDMGDSDINELLRERLRQRGELDNSFGDLYDESEDDESIEKFYEEDLNLDTTQIALNDPSESRVEGIEELDLTRIMDEGKSYFERAYYDKAAKRFYYLYETSLEENELYDESVYYLAESHLMKNRFSEALKYFEIVISKNQDNEFTEKALIRAGQIYCVLNLKDRAEKYFTKLKNDFPDSDFISVANCKSVE